MRHARILNLIALLVALMAVAMAAAYCAADEATDKARAILIWGDATVSATAKVADPAPSSGGDLSMPAAHVKSDAAVAPVVSTKSRFSDIPKFSPPPKPALRSSGPHWTHPMADTKAELITHLLSDGVHRGRHTRAELAAMSYGQLEAIHDADHNANRAVRVTAPADCPNCNNPRRGLFGWRR